MTDFESSLFTLLLISVFITSILFVAFGQLTVRKLRKNPSTKDALGIEFASGWDILNVAQALTIPKAWVNKLKNRSLSAFYADADLLYENTSRFDRALAKVFYFFYLFTGVGGIFLVLLNIPRMFG